MSEVQLRDYRIAPGRLDDFVSGWTSRVVPLRRQFGFTVLAAWTIPDEHRFGWLLRYEGPGTFEEADRAYYASAERAAISPDPAELIVDNVTRFVDEVDLEAASLPGVQSPLMDSPP